MFRRISLVGVALLLPSVLILNTALAEEEGEKKDEADAVKYSLQYKFIVGEVFKFKETTTTDFKTDDPNVTFSVNEKVSIVEESTQKVTEVSEEQIATHEVTYDRIILKGQAGETPIEFDSAKAKKPGGKAGKKGDDAGGMMDHNMGDVYGGRIDKPFILRISKWGRVVGMEGYDKVSMPLPGSRIVGDEAFKMHFGIYNGMPEKEVAVGDTWECEYERSIPFYGTGMLCKVTYKLESVGKVKDKNCARITMATKIRSVDEGVPEEFAGPKPKGSGKGEMLFNIDDGRFASVTDSMTVTLEPRSDTGTTIQASWKFTFKRELVSVQ